MAGASPCKASEIRKGVTAIGAAGLIESRSKNVLRQHLTCVAEGVRLDEVVEHGADQISLRLHSVNPSSRSPLIALQSCMRLVKYEAVSAHACNHTPDFQSSYSCPDLS